ncbi:MAG: polysaccharide deacetylase family protein [Dehalococcoidales bacterium]
MWTRNKVRILSYHRVCDLPPTGDIMESLNINPVVFDRQMAWLSQKGYNVITPEQFIEYRDKNTAPPPKSIIITFDDGYRDNLLIALPILEKYGFRGTFLPVTDYIDSDRIFHWLKLGEKSITHSQANRQYWLPLTGGDIREMSARGACFGSHTKNHRYLTRLSPDEVAEELTASKKRLEDILGKPVVCFSYPHSDYNDTVKNLVKKAGYRAALTNEGANNTVKSDFLALKRVPMTGLDSTAAFRRRVEGGYDWVWWPGAAVKFLRRRQR